MAGLRAPGGRGLRGAMGQDWLSYYEWYFFMYHVVVLPLRRFLPLLAICLSAVPALAQVESVTSTALREKLIQQYVEFHTVPSRVAGKIGRWETGICVTARGLKPELLEFTVRRLKAVAALVGAPVNNDPSCRHNVEIGFASDPQSMMGYVRDKHINYLGFYNSIGQAEKKPTPSRPGTPRLPSTPKAKAIPIHRQAAHPSVGTRHCAG